LSEVDLREMMVMIPVGGEARRLRPLTSEASKAVVRIFNRPLVEFALMELARQGMREFVFGAKGYINYRSLFDYFREGEGFSAQHKVRPRAHIMYQPRIEDVGSADSVRILMDYYDVNDQFLVVQGDNLFELDVREMIAFQRKTGAFMVIALTPVEDVESYGIAEIDDSGRIRRFLEKPNKENTPSRMANSGIYLISPRIREVFEEPEVQAMINVNRRLDFGLDLIPYLAQKYPVYGFYVKGSWLDVGTPRGYLSAVARVLSDPARRSYYLGEPLPKLDHVWIQGGSADSVRRKEVIARKALSNKIQLEGSVLIGRHCQIEDGTIIRDSCVDNFCILGRDVTIERSAIMDRVVIEEGATIQDSIVGRHVRVGSSKKSPTWITGLSTVGDDVDVGEGATLVSTKVNPHRKVMERANLQGQFVE
jgi:NDP-sugar pyrophosphorylase family protein